MSKLPSSWVYLMLGEAIDYATTSKTEPSDISEDSWILELEDIEKKSSKLLKRVFFSERQSKSTKNKFNRGDVLYGKLRPYLDKVIIADKVGYCTTEIIPIKSGKNIDSRFLFYSLKRKEFLDYVSEVSYGLNMPRLGAKQGRKAPFALAPLNEQIRIANKLDSLLAKVDAAQVRLEKIPTLLKRFRQSVLAAATSGELTRGWRENTDISWPMTYLKEVATGFNYGSSTKSKTKGKVPVLRMGNLQGGKLDWEKLVFTSDETEIKKYTLQKRDVLFNRTNSPELVGKTSIYRGERAAIFAGYMIRIKGSKLLDSEYLNIQLNSPHARNYCWRVKTDGVSQSNINAKKIQAYEFELPPPREQKEIARRVESLFALADAVEKKHLEAKKRTDRLTQSLLAKAFRGELVPQDANDEPASELLKRIQTEREQTANKSKQKNTTRKPRNSTKTRTIKKTDIMKLTDAPENYLLNLLTQLGGETPAEVLWKKSELAIDDFYAKLKQEMQSGDIVDDNSSPDPTLHKLKLAAKAA